MGDSMVKTLQIATFLIIIHSKEGTDRLKNKFGVIFIDQFILTMLFHYTIFRVGVCCCFQGGHTVQVRTCGSCMFFGEKVHVFRTVIDCLLPLTN